MGYDASTFWTELDRYLGDYDEAERMAEIEADMLAEADDYAVHGEDAILIPGDLVAEPDEPVWYVTSEGRQSRLVFVPGIDGDPWGRDL